MFIVWMEPNVSGTSGPWRDPEESFATLLPQGKSMPLRSTLLLILSRWERFWMARPICFEVACFLIIRPQRARDMHTKAWQQILWRRAWTSRTLSVRMECSGSLLCSVQPLAMCGCWPFKRWLEQWKDWLFIYYQNIQFPKYMWLSLSAVNWLAIRPSEEISRRGSFFPPTLPPEKWRLIPSLHLTTVSSWQVNEVFVRGSPVKSPESRAARSLSPHAM